MKAMLQHARSRVAGLHPLFGPAPDPDEGPLTVAACKGRGESEFQWIRRLLLGEGYRVKEVDPAAHDRLMAVIQGANHFSTMALALFLSRCGIPPRGAGRLEHAGLSRCAGPHSRPDRTARGPLSRPSHGKPGRSGPGDPVRGGRRNPDPGPLRPGGRSVRRSLRPPGRRIRKWRRVFLRLSFRPGRAGPIRYTRTKRRASCMRSGSRRTPGIVSW